MKKVAALLAGLLLIAGAESRAEKVVLAPNPFRDILSQSTAAELPTLSADLVKKAKARDWGETVANVIHAALEINPTAAPSIVAAIAKSVPEVASIAASTAAAAQPKQAVAIASAAVAAAPSRAAKILTAVCRAVPSQYGEIALAIAQVMPGCDLEMLNALSEAVPALSGTISAYMTAHPGAPSVGAVVTQAKAVVVPSSDPVSTPAAGIPGLTPGGFARGISTLPPSTPSASTPSGSTPPVTGNVRPSRPATYQRP